MGLNYAGLIMDVEEHSGIVIADEELEAIRKVADLGMG